jgi:hypothetical protein
MVTEVPPRLDPELGMTLVMVGAGATYVKPFARVPLCLFGFVTTTLTAPAACGGVLAVIDVLLTTRTLVAAEVPNFNVAPLTKPVPVMVTAVPPLVGPEVGLTAVTETVDEAPTASVVESVAPGLSKLSAVLAAFRAHTVIR